MGKASLIVASMPEVNRAVGQGADRFARFARAEAAGHGRIPILVYPEGFDYIVSYEKYDEKGRGFGGPLELGHINVPRGGKWTPGIRVFRLAILKSAVVV